MAGNAWIMTGYANESEATGTGEIDYVMSPTGSWIPILDPVTNTRDLTLINGAATYADINTPIEEARAIQGEFQAVWTDRDVRMERVNVTITYPAV